MLSGTWGVRLEMKWKIIYYKEIRESDKNGVRIKEVQNKDNWCL
jgi:hypothetical protein